MNKRYQSMTTRKQGCLGLIVLVLILGLCNSMLGSDDEEPLPTPTAESGAQPFLSAETEVPEPTEAEAEPTDTSEEPTETAEPATNTPEPQPTTEPPTAEPQPTEAPAPTAEPPTAAPAPTQPPAPAPVSGAVSDLAEAPPDGQPWLPCAEGQVKANINTKIYHVSGGASYGNTFRNVWCFNSTAEAEANGYRAARN